MTPMLFLPGAGGSAAFWRPVADRLDPARKRRFFAWPGLGNEPHDPGIRGIDDLVAMVVAGLDEPADLIAQSMGGLVALRVALAVPAKVRHLVLVATSAGHAVGDLGGVDWRADYRRDFPAAARWITEVHEDLSPRLASVAAPCRLIWGDADRISPVPVGRRLQSLLPNADLRIVPGGDHDLAQTHAVEVARLIAEHLH